MIVLFGNRFIDENPNKVLLMLYAGENQKHWKEVYGNLPYLDWEKVLSIKTP